VHEGERGEKGRVRGRERQREKEIETKSDTEIRVLTTMRSLPQRVQCGRWVRG
jgi:hypothetical protein